MQVNMHEAKSQLSKLVQAVLNGEQVVIARNGAPVVQRIKHAPVKVKRKPGSLKGQICLADDWDSPETKRIINDMMIPMELRASAPRTLIAAEPIAAYHVKKPKGKAAGQRKK